jgi:AcrR family transcriptional regulator
MDTATLPPRTRKARGQGASRRGEILLAAKQLFLEEGVEHATMRRIAAAVGVSPTALYVYFPDKSAILQAIADAMFGELLAVHAESQQKDGTPLDRFRAGLHAYVSLGLARADEYRLTFSTIRMTSACRDVSAADQSFEMLERGVAELMEAGVFARLDTTLVAEALWAVMHGVVVLLLDHDQHIVSDHQTLVDTLLDAAICGFTAPASRERRSPNINGA